MSNRPNVNVNAFVYTVTPSHFATTMTRQLTRNEKRGDWKEWKPALDVLEGRIRRNMEDIKGLVTGHSSLSNEARKIAITAHCADIGNFVMKLSEMYGALEISEPQPSQRTFQQLVDTFNVSVHEAQELWQYLMFLRQKNWHEGFAKAMGQNL